MSCRTTSVDSITFCHAGPLSSGVDTVRATQMHVNTEFSSLPHLFVRNDVKMHVSASILVNTVAYGLGEGKQLRKKTVTVGYIVHSSLMRLSVS